MFDLSFTEMILAGTVALIVLGPERLPKVARTIGRLVGKIQNFTTTMKQEFTSQNEYADLMKIKNDVESAAQNIRNEINDFEQQIQKENQDIQQLTQPIVDTRPAWERLPEQRTPADFGIVSPSNTHQTFSKIGFHTPSLRQRALQRKRETRPHHRKQPKFRSKH